MALGLDQEMARVANVVDWLLLCIARDADQRPAGTFLLCGGDVAVPAGDRTLAHAGHSRTVGGDWRVCDGRRRLARSLYVVSRFNGHLVYLFW